MKAMIFAAGLGTRLQQFTSHQPKALVPVDDRPLIDHILLKLKREGFTEVVVNVHHFADLLKAHLRQVEPTIGLRLIISDESEALLNTGGGLRKAMPLILSQDDSQPLLIHNVDILSNARLQPLCAACQGNADAVLLVSERQTSRYLLFSDQMELQGWTNVQTGEIRSPHPHLDPSHCHKYAFSGIHVVAPRLNALLQSWPERFSIMDFYISQCAQLKFRGIVQSDLQLLDVGKPDALQRAPLFLRQLSD